ncbi:Hypothetical protein AAM4_2673 [Actinomyces succiniciruminis]|uniref:Uncharacterized protein n=1 Tax=Actinomyces succiniciruminis TaxID=1522002 RepID=A0A1L7REJ5_9ACTO|nr:Hypothetical protein AAM4_2673 [Actinomyces succiniciruminis]
MAEKAVNGSGRVSASRHTVTVADRTVCTPCRLWPTSGSSKGASSTWAVAATASVGSADRWARAVARPMTTPSMTPTAATSAPTVEPKGTMKGTVPISSSTVTSNW